MFEDKSQKQAISFSLGRVVATPGALEAMQASLVPPEWLLARHQSGDWGDLDDDDKKANDLAVVQGDRIFSSYNLPTGKKIWVITEWDRSVTTLLLPEDY